jgi:hypothetical protein
MSHEEVLRRLEAVLQEIAILRREIQETWSSDEERRRTTEFLRKCQGWEDDRAPEEVIAEIHASRTSSDRGKVLPEGESR